MFRFNLGRKADGATAEKQVTVYNQFCIGGNVRAPASATVQQLLDLALGPESAVDRSGVPHHFDVNCCQQPVDFDYVPADGETIQLFAQ